MILHCNYEELRALVAGAELVTGEVGFSDGAVAAPCRAAAQVEELLPRLSADLSIATLAEQRRVQQAVAAICAGLHDRLDVELLEHNPAHETAVALYFEYAHVRTVLERLHRMGAAMEGMIELLTGVPANSSSAESITFPD